MGLLLLLLSQGLSAEETFRKVEGTALEATTLQVGCRIKPEPGKSATVDFSGTAAFKGAKLAWQLDFKAPGPKQYRIITDGTRLLWEEPGWSNAGDLPKGFDRLHRLLIVRVGLYSAFMYAYTPYHPGERNQDPNDEANWKVADFAHGPDDGAAKTLHYSIWVRAAKEPLRVRMTYDPKTWAVLGHAMGENDEKLKNAVSIRMEWKSGPEIPDDLFKIAP